MYEKVQTNIKGKTLRSSLSQMLKIAVVKKFAITVNYCQLLSPVLECLFNKFGGL